MIFDKYKLVIFDADGTLRECTVEGQEYPIEHDQWVSKANVFDEVKKYDWNEKYFGIATNQPGVSLNKFSDSMCVALIEDMVKETFGYLPNSAAMQYCPHHIDGGCDCRKPQPGMLKRVMQHYQIEPSDTIFVGDSARDKGAAKNAGCSFIWVHDIQ